MVLQKDLEGNVKIDKLEPDTFSESQRIPVATTRKASIASQNPFRRFTIDQTH